MPQPENWKHGRAWFIGDRVSTEQIIPHEYLSLGTAEALGGHVLGGLDMVWAGRFRRGDVLFAGHDFGWGDPRDQAALALRGAGLACVVARSFDRYFVLSARANRLQLVTLPVGVSSGVQGQDVWYDLRRGQLRFAYEGVALQGEVSRRRSGPQALAGAFSAKL